MQVGHLARPKGPFGECCGFDLHSLHDSMVVGWVWLVRHGGL